MNNKIIVGVVVIVLIIGFFVIFNKSILDNNVIPEIKQIDLENHPLYKDYDFSQNEKVIDLGDQPFWSPTSFISEFMKRDLILQAELSKLGYSLRIHHFLKGDDVNHFLLKGDLEVGIGGDMPALRAAEAGGVIVAAIVQEGPITIISKNINEVEKLKGKRIGYAFGSNAHFYLLNTLDKHDIKISEVDLIPMDVNFMPDALNDGEIDAFAAWEMTPTLALEKYPSLIVTHRGRSYGFIYVRKELIEKSPEVVYHLLASEIRALRWIKKSNNNLNIASRWIVDEINKLSNVENDVISLEKMADIINDDLPGIYIKEYPRISNDLLSDDGPLKDEFEFLQDLNLISKESQWGNVKNEFNQELIEIVINNPEKYKLFENGIDGEVNR